MGSKQHTSSFLSRRDRRELRMPLPPAVPQHLRTAGQDGYRTPTIEDPEHPFHPFHRHRLHSPNLTRTTSRVWHDIYHGRPPTSTGVPAGFKRRDSTSHDTEDEDRPKQLTWKLRMRHVTWAYFTLTMATGGIANVLSAVPFRFHGLRSIGLIFFFLNLVLYIVIWAMITIRFTLYPYTFRGSFTHPTESLFVPAFAVSFGTILITIVEYGFGEVGTWLNRAVLVLYWFDCALAIFLSITIYLILWSTQSFTIARMTPIWIFPAYPLLIIGPHAANLSERLPSPDAALRVIVGGFTIQGIGMLIALTMYSAFVYRLMTQKMPSEPLRPGMFVSVGPAAFTVSGVVGMAASLPKALSQRPSDTYMNVNSALVADVLKVVANWSSLWLWGLAFWFFFVSLAANLACLRNRHHHVPFAMTWFSFVFPQTALTSATLRIGEAFQSKAIQWIGCVMTVLLIIVWFFVVSMMIRAIILKQIMWPELGEDRREGGFEMEVGTRMRIADLEEAARSLGERRQAESGEAVDERQRAGTDDTAQKGDDQGGHEEQKDDDDVQHTTERPASTGMDDSADFFALAQQSS